MDYLNQLFDLSAAPPASVPPSEKKASASPKGRRAQQEGQCYGGFQLTEAVRPSPNAKIRPTQGFRYDKYVDEESKSEIPVIMAAASRDVLFSVFVQLIQQLGQVVDVVLETSHEHEVSGHCDLYREQIDMPVLTSVLMEFENLLVNDGCTGIAVLNPKTPQEVQFDEHKLLIMYGNPLEAFEEVLEQHGITCQPTMHFVTEAEHIHASNQYYREQFEVLCNMLGTEEERGGELET
jgi:hypothetical protein